MLVEVLYIYIYYFLRPTRTSDAFLLYVGRFVNMSKAFSSTIILYEA